MMKIIVTREGDRFRAEMEERPEIWGSASTCDGAVGNLVSNNELACGIEVEVPEGERHSEFDCPLRRATA